MEPDKIIAIAKEAGVQYRINPVDTREMWCWDSDLIRFAALHREALIASGELVPRDKSDTERLNWMEKNVSAIRDIGWINGPLREAIDRARSQP